MFSGIDSGPYQSGDRNGLAAVKGFDAVVEEFQHRFDKVREHIGCLRHFCDFTLAGQHRAEPQLGMKRHRRKAAVVKTECDLIGRTADFVVQCNDIAAHSRNDHFDLMDAVFPETAAAALRDHAFHGEKTAGFDQFIAKPQSRTGKERGVVFVSPCKQPFCRRFIRSKRFVDVNRLSGCQRQFSQLFVDLGIGGSQHTEGITIFQQFFQRSICRDIHLFTPDIQRTGSGLLFPCTAQLKLIAEGGSTEPRRIIIGVPFIQIEVDKTDFFHSRNLYSLTVFPFSEDS